MLISLVKTIILAFSAVFLTACHYLSPSDHVHSQVTYIARDYVSDGVFTSGIEGPAIGPDGYLYLVNYSEQGTIGRVTPKSDGTGAADLFLKLPGNSIGNGVRFDLTGLMYVVDYAGHNILQLDLATRQVSVFAHNNAMNQPNDIAITASGILYASDPNWSDNTGKLWRIDRDGSTHLLESEMGTTNGIEVSPDEKHLFVNESIQRKVWVYDRQPDGTLINKRLLIEFSDFGLDGMRCDSEGNLYIARFGAGVVAMVSPEGRLLREIPLKGKAPTNLAFGGVDGKSLFVTLQDRGAIETFRVEHPGRSYMLRASTKKSLKIRNL